jgi:sugar O-acyltransferase (sialic acid O-acetyltransferase NeuD family)
MHRTENNRRKLLMFGTGLMSERMHFYFDRDSSYAFEGFVIDRAHMTSSTHLGLPVFEAESLPERCPPSDYDVFVAVGYSQSNRAREAVFDRLAAMGYELASFVSSTAAVNIDEPGQGTVILDNTTVGPCCSIGRGVFIGPNTVASHHVDIAEFTYISSSVTLLGGCSIGKRVFLGGGAIIRDGVSIADGTSIGMGAVVNRSIEAPGLYSGMPARLIRKF